MSLLGHLDAVRHRTVFGWAHDSRRPDLPPRVRIFVNGNDSGFAIADRPRPDLALAGITTYPRGFEWCIPDSCSNVESVRVISADGSVELASSGSPICKQTNRPLPPEWRSGRQYRFPSFFILGAAKCGTTSLHSYLGQHPEICVSNPKEPFYFEAELDRGPSYYFSRYFAHWAGERIVGEARHRNLYMPYAAERIFQFNPRARLIVCVRNPVERAISHWWHWYSRNEEHLSLGQCIEQDWQRIQAGMSYEDQRTRDAYARTLDANGKGMFRTYVDSGYYFDQIQRYMAFFPAQQLQIVLLEDLAADPTRKVADLFGFLGADPTYIGNYAPLNRSDQGMLKHLDSGTLSWLVQHYRPHNEALAQLIGRSLDGWDVPFSNLRP